MQTALANRPMEDREIPPGVVHAGNDFFYVENQPGRGVGSLGLTDGSPDQQKKQESIRNELF